MNRQTIFSDVKAARGGKAFTAPEVAALDAALDALGVPRDDAPAKRKVGPKGIALMHRWEGCKLKAYPDPGSRDGKPWTIGRGSTGPDIGPGTVWTQEQADARFEKDLEKYAAEVSKAIGDAPTTQEQFDALVAFHYNTGKIGSATLTKKHVAGDKAGAALEFRKWVNNDGRRMQGLVNRRADEEKLYRGLA
jgi:lysozyme